MKLDFVDIHKELFHAHARREVFVELLLNADYAEGMRGKLNNSLYGTRVQPKTGCAPTSKRWRT